MEFFNTTLVLIQDNINNLETLIEKLERNQNHSNSHNSQTSNDSSSLRITALGADSLLKGIKLEIPQFSRTDALGWIFRVS